MQKYKMYIGGKWVEAASGKTYIAVNPVTEDVIAEIPLGGPEDADRAVAAAKKAFPEWAATSQGDRSKILLEIARELRKHVPELVDIEILDHGTPLFLAQALASEAPTHFEFAAEISRKMFGDVIPISQTHKLYLQREPIGVCALIIPWNTPIPMTTQKLSASLATGNASVLKPPTIDSLPSLKIAEIIDEMNILPKGLFNVITGPGEAVGEALAMHRDVGMVSFTGSCEVGKRIMSCASATVKHLGLELGGKNPFIVLHDADIDAATTTAVRATTFNTGMVCASPGRYYLHESIYEEFVKKFVAGLNRVVVGDPRNDKTTMGPVVSTEHRDRIEKYIKSGIDEGATLLLGGQRPTEPPLDKGYFVMPTVFADVTPEMTIYREEIFGPVACLTKFSSEDGVIAAANDNTFGLAASVWSASTATALRIANELQAGTVWINDHMFICPDLPWGGYKQSGLGKEGGARGLEEYTRTKVISLDVSK